MDLADLLAEWKEDAKVNRLKILEEISRTPILHSKYLEQLVFFKAKAIAAREKLNAMKNIKRRYYRGEFTKADLDKYEWEQWQGLKPSAAELNQLFEQDPDLNELESKLEYYTTALTSIEYIMRAISSRGYELKTMVDYIKFEAGG